jgi:hypothetical protein
MSLEAFWRLGHWRQVPLWLWGVLILCYAITLPKFIVWTNWYSALTPQEAISQSPDLVSQIDPKWKAVVIEHGHVREWPLGTVTQNPEGYRRARMEFDVSVILVAIAGISILIKASVQPKD